ncbi:MAG TPA: gliding motility lipoprotein GldH, partial [Prolixibacteraceae bacterium]|nr:gliding motility lipoprotein GldH [Prolixibacteraceae bacterium]
RTLGYSLFLIRPLVLLSVLFLILSGCDKEKFFDESKSIPSDTWPADKELAFNVDIRDTISAYRFYINVRNSASYRYSNVYFFLTTEFPGGGMSRDTIECTLADKTGKWLGRGTGNYRDNRVFIRENIRFPRMGTYTFRLNQAMRVEELKGISEAGIRLEKQQ